MRDFYELDGFVVKSEKKSALAHVDCYEDSPVYEMMSEEYDDIIDEMMGLAKPVGIIGFGTMPESAATQECPAGTPILYGVVSIGGAISEQSTRGFEEGEYVRGMLCDSIANQLLFSMEGRLIECLREICMEHQVGVLRRLEAPHDLPMTVQREAWKHLELEKRFGIGISSGNMFDPVKTNCNVYILTENPELFRAQHDCRRCSNYACKFRNLPPSRILLNGGGKTREFEVSHGETLMAAMIREGCYVDAICGGNGRCGKCRVRVLEGEAAISSQDQAFFSAEELEQGWRLSCTLYPMDDLTVEYSSEKDAAFEVLTEFRVEKTPVSQAEQQSEREQTAETGYKIAVDIGTTTIAFALLEEGKKEILHAVTLLNSQRKYGADVISRIEKSVAGEKEALRECIQADLRQGIDQLLREYAAMADCPTEEAARDGKRRASGLSGSALRDSVKQIAIGGNTTMGHLLMGYDCDTLGIFPFTPVNVDFIQRNAAQLLGISGGRPQDAADGVIGEEQNPEMKKDVEERAFEKAQAVILPGISAFVGGDITAGMSACGFGTSGEICLLVDLGTNGEMALGNKDRILVTSTAAGPAFEGGNIVWGTGSISGAVCAVSVNKGEAATGKESGILQEHFGIQMTGKIGMEETTKAGWFSLEVPDSDWTANVRTIQNVAPVGICGTGVIESVSELVRTELVDETGLLDEDYFDDGFPLAQTADGKQIVFTQKDVREIQLAKAAVRAGIETLLIRYGISKEQVAKVYIAGGFGFRLDLDKAIAIGMIPEEFEGRIEAVGNSCLAGTIKYLQESRMAADAGETEGGAAWVGTEYISTELSRLVKISEEINLSADKNFNEFYMEYMMFEG